MHFNVFSSIPNLCPLNTNNTLHRVVTTENVALLLLSSGRGLASPLPSRQDGGARL